MKTIKDTVFKCDCKCGSELAIGAFGEGRFAVSVKEAVDDGQTAHWNETIISPEQVKKIIKLLT